MKDVLEGVKTKSGETTWETFVAHAKDDNGLNSDRKRGDGRNRWIWELLKERKGLIQLNDCLEGDKREDGA